MSLLSFTSPRIKPDQELKEELAAMTEEERKQAQNDIRGRRTIVHETPELLIDALGRLEDELDSIAEKEAFELAQDMCPEYVDGDEFRLMFLRSTKFDIAPAAQKIVKYWDRKVVVFGADRAFRKLSIADFDEEDLVALNLGGIRALPERDKFGRGVIFQYRAYFDHRPGHRMSMVRTSWKEDVVDDMFALCRIQ